MGGMLCDAVQNVSQPGLRVDVIHLGGLCRPPNYLTDVLERIVSGRTKINQLHMLLPWNWKAERDSSQAKLAA